MGSLRTLLLKHIGGFCRRHNICLENRPTIGFCCVSSVALNQFSNTKKDFGYTKQISMESPSIDAKPLIGPVKMNIDSKDFQSLFTPGLRHVHQLFQQHKFELCIAGGAVRDLLMGIKPKDIDFATTATPEEMIMLFKSEGIRLINEGGVSHGTVTCRIHEENFEITTLRIDKITDGRHAVVEFTKDWYQDASRRDLTINSIFLDMKGNVIDFFNGVEDLKNKRVRFVGNATTRIKEDYLRILRYFRFFGRIADDDAEFDNDAILAITEEGKGLVGISGPRIWMEMSKILTGNYIAKIIRQMHHCGILQYIGFPQELKIDAVECLEAIYNKTKHLDVNHMTYTSALLNTEKDVLQLEERTQFSRIERKTALFIVAYRDKIKLDDPPSSRLKFCQDIIVDIPAHEGGHKNFVIEVLKYIGDFETMTLLQDWDMPKFPLNGKILTEAGVPKGKKIGIVMKLLKEKWKESHFLLSGNELLQHVPKILESL